MLEKFEPTLEELEMAELEHVLRRNRNDITTQEGLVASLVHDILNFDYYYHYSDDGSVWRKGEERKEDINARLDQVEDAALREQLESCFFVTKYEKVLTLVTWGKYHRKMTDYVFFRWDGADHEKACQLMVMKSSINQIIGMVNEVNLGNRVIYSDNILAATKLLRDGINWDKRERLYPVTVPDRIYNAVEHLGKQYLNGELTYADIKTLYRVNSGCMLLMGDDGWTVEVIRIRNFFMIFIGGK